MVGGGEDRCDVVGVGVLSMARLCDGICDDGGGVKDEFVGATGDAYFKSGRVAVVSFIASTIVGEGDTLFLTSTFGSVWGTVDEPIAISAEESRGSMSPWDALIDPTTTSRYYCGDKGARTTCVECR